MRRAVNPEARGVADPWKKFATPLRIVETQPTKEKRLTLAELVKAAGLQFIDGKVCA